MQLSSVRILVTDLPAAAAFYADVVGLEQIGSAPGAALFGTNPQLVIETAGPEAHAEGLAGRFAGVSFATENATERQPWAGNFPHTDDPSGNTITFLQRPDQSAAWEGGKTPDAIDRGSTPTSRSGV